MVPANVVVVVVAPDPTDTAEAVGAETLAAVVLGVPVIVIGEDMVVCFCIYILKFSPGYFNEREQV